MQVALSQSSMETLALQFPISGANSSLCEHFAAEQTAQSELLVDIAWLLKEPDRDGSGAICNSINLQRLTSLLKFSIQNELIHVLEAIMDYWDAVTTVGIQDAYCLMPEADRELFQESVQSAKEILSKRALCDAISEPDGSIKKRNMLLPRFAMDTKIQVIIFLLRSGQG